jgi:hypothetical protein
MQWSARRGADAGQAVGLVVIAIGMIGTLGLGLTAVATRMTDRSRAQTAADSAALAGVTGGAAAASTLAARNGGALVSFVERQVVGGVEVTVQVTVGDERAQARASDAP